LATASSYLKVILFSSTHEKYYLGLFTISIYRYILP